MIHRHSNDLHFRQITTLLRRRWLFLATLVVLGGGAAAAIGFSLPPRYTAKAQLLYQLAAQEGSERSDETAVDTLVEMLISPSHLHRLAQSLEADPAPTQAPPQPAAPGFWPARNVSAGPPILNSETLTEGLDVYKERQSRLIAITFSSTYPEVSAVVANRAVDLYLDLESDFEREKRTRALDAIAGRMTEARSRIDDAEGALREHRIRFGLNENAAPNPADRQIGEFARLLAVARADLAARNAQIETWSGQQAGVIGDGAATTGPMQVAARDERAATGSQPASPTAPPHGRDDDSPFAQLVLERDAVEARTADIERRLATLQEAGTNTTAAWIRLRELDREANAAGQAYETLLARKAELQGQGIVPSPARLVTVATAPDRPSSPNPLLFILPAVIASFLVAGLLAILFERLDQRLRSEQDVEETLGAPCAGLVPRIWDRRSAMLPGFFRDKPFAPFTEAIRSIFVAATRQSTQSILVTGSTRGAGNTTLVLSLAAFAAQLGKRVLVIDLNLRHPRLLALIDETGRDASTTETARPIGLAGAGLRTSETYGVDYLALPLAQTDPLNVLSEVDFPKLMEQFKQSYDCILIDSAPAGRAAETRLLAAMVDRVLFTVRWGVTEAGPAIAAMQHLRAATADGAVPISVVVNRVNLGTHRRRRYSEPMAMALAEAPA